MQANENKALVQRIFDEVLNVGKLEVADELYDAACTFHNLPPGFEGMSGPAVIKGACVAFGEAFPDTHYKVQEMFTSEDDRVVVRWTVDASHKKALRLGPREAPPTDAKVHAQGMSILRCQAGKVCEVWQVVDMSAIFPPDPS